MSSESVTYIQRFSWIFNILFHQALAVVTVYILCTALVNGASDSLATWHMVLTPFGFLFLMMESFILFTNTNIPTLQMARIKKQYVHGTLQFLSTVFITVGISFRISTKEGDHFTSTHAILGLVAWILVWCSVILGLATSQSQHLKKIAKPVVLKLLHTLIGICAFTFGIIALCFGLKNYFKSFSGEDTINAAVVTIALLYLWALFDPFRALYAHIRSVFAK
ncbi:uncharacterized protein LOC123011352 [Tribolium madens]|uniref:uncharacterized protein LOC123011352 n=1 Tax=Tribolium madens TaxID=41895 RepID=UPI001CF7673A|nr:uncharacterized protein LOC123011352 [Tribolium madens]